MGYRKITNLYRSEASGPILEQTEVYALEKIHGTSANVSYHRDTGLKLFPGGIKLSTFIDMMDQRFNLSTITQNFIEALRSRPKVTEITVFGEAYGGKCQKMSDIYGTLNFIAFEVKIDEDWLPVKSADKWVKHLGFLEFIHYEKGPATVEWLNAQRDKPSTQAARNGMGEKFGEGIVIRPLLEKRDHRGNRIIAKHKREEFRETKSVREVDPEKQRIWREARATADEFVVAERLNHVIDKLVATKPGFEFSLKNTRTVIGAMLGDIRKEEGDDIKWSNEVQKSIGAASAKLYKEYLNDRVE